MYPGAYAETHPDRPAIIMAGSGEVITFRDYEARCNRFAHYLRHQGLNIDDHYAMLPRCCIPVEAVVHSDRCAAVNELSR